ncbi:MAG: ATP-binding protein [Tepidisphaerales bacterium]
MERNGFLHMIQGAFRSDPVVALLGPRQCGKTTLARFLFEKQAAPRANYFDLEDPEDIARLVSPKLALADLNGLVVIDEIQRRPELFPVLRVLVDRPGSASRFLVLGSASPDLIRQSSESLAGRVAFLELSPFNLGEVGVADQKKLWLRGGFPRSFLAETDQLSDDWRKGYVRTFLERDIPSLGVRTPPEQMRRFWIMLAHFHGQILNASEIGRSMEMSDTTVKRHLDLLCGTFMVRRLAPYHANIAKRQVKTPKIYIRDSGLLHHLFGIKTHEQLLVNPKLGASWEGFAIEQVVSALRADPGDLYFWAVHEQAELDLLLLRDGRRLGFEIKYTDSPALTSSMQRAIEALQLDELTVVYPGDMEFRLADGVLVRGLSTIR